MFSGKQLFLTAADEAVILTLNTSLKYKPIETTRQNGWLWEAEQKPSENLQEGPRSTTHPGLLETVDCFRSLARTVPHCSLEKSHAGFNTSLSHHIMQKANLTFRLMSTFSFIFIATAKKSVDDVNLHALYFK